MSKADQLSTDVSTHTQHQHRWNPSSGNTSSRLVTCRNELCDNEYVDREFARILGDENANVYACPECTSWTALRHGAAAKPNFEGRVRHEWPEQGAIR